MTDHSSGPWKYPPRTKPAPRWFYALFIALVALGLAYILPTLAMAAGVYAAGGV